MRSEEASHAQHLRDEELAASLHQELGQIRSEVVQTFSNSEQQAQGEGQHLALEYQRLVDELNKKARENLRTELSCGGDHEGKNGLDEERGKCAARGGKQKGIGHGVRCSRSSKSLGQRRSCPI